jgi:hypothetical protein
MRRANAIQSAASTHEIALVPSTPHPLHAVADGGGRHKVTLQSGTRHKVPSVVPEHLHRGGLRITVEDRIDMLHDVGAHVEKAPLVRPATRCWSLSGGRDVRYGSIVADVSPATLLESHRPTLLYFENSLTVATDLSTNKSPDHQAEFPTR